jgi:ribosomal protein S18 acetylase RimI-like enzyme
LPLSITWGSSFSPARNFPILYRTWDPYEVTEYFSSDPEYCLVAEAKGVIVGFLLATTIEKEGTAWKKYGYLAWIGVDEAFQRNRLARRLYKDLEKRLGENGVRMVIADTDGDNEAAIAFFQNAGFSTQAQHLWLSKTLHRKAKKAVKLENQFAAETEALEAGRL